MREWASGEGTMGAEEDDAAERGEAASRQGLGSERSRGVPEKPADGSPSGTGEKAAEEKTK